MRESSTRRSRYLAGPQAECAPNRRKRPAPPSPRSIDIPADLLRLSGCDCVTCCGQRLDLTREIIRRSVEEYVNLVDQHPNVLRVFIQEPLGKRSTVRALNEGRRSRWPWRMFNNELREDGLSSRAGLAAFAAFGSRRIGNRSGGWARTRQPAPRTA